MAFSEDERKALLAVHGVGTTVVARLEEVGIDSFAALSGYDAATVTTMVASRLRATCWRNSPQALAAINAAIARAKRGVGFTA